MWLVTTVLDSADTEEKVLSDVAALHFQDGLRRFSSLTKSVFFSSPFPLSPQLLMIS